MATATYEPISSTSFTAATASHTFSSIPSTYKHLQIVAFVKSSTSTPYMQMRYNSDSGNNYNQINWFPSAGSWGSGGNYSAPIGYVASNGMFNSSTFGNLVIDIVDYTNTNTEKNFIAYGGSQAQEGEMTYGVWHSSSAINNIYLQLSAGNFATGTTITLYGLLGS
jgi:hypothetical protein